MLAANEPKPETSVSRLVKYYQRNFRPPVEPRPWLLELSGRLLSLSPDLMRDVGERVATLNAQRPNDQPPIFRYRGRWKAPTTAVRAANCDVMHEPTSDDPA